MRTLLIKKDRKGGDTNLKWISIQFGNTPIDLFKDILMILV